MHLSFLSYALIFITGVSAQIASGPSSGAIIGSQYPVYNLTQQINHNSSSTGTFNHRFQLVTDFFKPGGPILFSQSAEETLVPVENNQFMDAAQELGAIVATLEHRYFGTSFPDNFDGSTASYAPLTLENIMADAVTFINFIKKNVTGAADSKTIVNGGSYGGNPALAMRVKHPETFFGAMPSAPITESFGPLENNSAKFRSAEQLHNIYYDASANAAPKIQKSLLEFYNCAYIGKNCSTAIPDMGLCGSTPNATQYIELYQTVLANYQLIPQFNYPITDVYAIGYPFGYLINTTEAATSTGETLRIPLAMVNWQESLSDCIDWTSRNISGKVDIQISNSWLYILCQWYGISQSSVPEGNIFPPEYVSSRAETCSVPAYQGINYNQTNEFWQNYLATTSDIINQTSRLVIFQGGYDRVAGIGSPALPLRSDREQSRVIFTAGLAHTEDTFPERFIPKGILPDLDHVRDTKVAIMKEWLGYSNSSSLWDKSADTLPMKDSKELININDNDDDKHPDSKAKKIVIIVGVVLGVLGMLGAISLTVFLCCCYRKRYRSRPSGTDMSVVSGGFLNRGWQKVDGEEPADSGAFLNRGWQKADGEELLRPSRSSSPIPTPYSHE